VQENLEDIKIKEEHYKNHLKKRGFVYEFLK